jgi:signal transduction histidine kinase
MCEYLCDCTYNEIVIGRHDLAKSILSERNLEKGINHEVRTSLNAIMGFGQILNTENVTAEETKLYAGIICQQSELLLSIFSELLNHFDLNSEGKCCSGLIEETRR